MVKSGNDLALKIGLTIYERDEPEIYEVISSLPKSPMRRHNAIIGLLRLGVMAQRGGVLPVAAGTEPVKQGAPAIKTTGKHQVEVAPAVKENPESQDELFYEEIDISNEIAEMYGGN